MHFSPLGLHIFGILAADSIRRTGRPRGILVSTLDSAVEVKAVRVFFGQPVVAPPDIYPTSNLQLSMDAHQFDKKAAIATSTWPYFLLGLFLAPSVCWIIQDHSVWPWDQAWYAEVSTNLWFTFIHHPDHWWLEMVRALGIKAPGIAWLGEWFVPIGRMLGSIELGLLLSIILVQFWTLSLMYQIGKEFMSDQDLGPILGSIVVASAPLFVAMSHQYLAEPLQLFAVTYVYWIAATGQNWTRSQLIGHLLCAASLGLASKVTTPLYCFIPACLAVYDGVKEKNSARASVRFSVLKSKFLLLAGTIMLGTVVSWYARNGSALGEFVMIASSSDVALDYGTSGTFFSKIQYWLVALQKSVVLPQVLSGLAIVLLVAIGIRFAADKKSWLPPTGRLSLLAMAAFGHVVLVLATFSLSINEENRYLLPLFPSLGVIFMWCLTWVKMRAALMLLGVLFVGQWAYVESRAFGFVPPDSSMSYWVLPIQRNNDAMNELNRIVTLTCTPGTAHRYSVTGVELPWLNANSMAFYAAKWKQESQLECHYTSLGYAEKDLSRAWERLNQLKIMYFISLEERALPQPPNFVNQVSLSMLKQIRTDTRFVQLPYHSKLNVIVFRNDENTTTQ
jgi:hypothetical protein